jgi:hypothetical protein
MGDALAKLFEVASCRFLCVDGSPPAGRGKAAVKLAPPARLQPCLSESHQLHLDRSLISHRTSGLFSCWSTRTRVVSPPPLRVPGARKFHDCTGVASMHSAAQQPGNLNLPAGLREFQRDDRRHLYPTTTVRTGILHSDTSKQHQCIASHYSAILRFYFGPSTIIIVAVSPTPPRLSLPHCRDHSLRKV